MNISFWQAPAESWRNFFISSLAFFIPLNLLGSEFSISCLYITTIVLFVKKREHWEKSVIQKGILILFTGYVISTIFAENSLESLRYLRKFWKFGLPFLVFLALRNQSENRYLKILMYMAGLICLYGIVQYFTGIDVLRTGKLERNLYKISNSWHAIGNFSHHLTYGGVFLLIFPVYLAPVFSSDFDPKERIIFGVVSVIIFLSVVFSLGRSSFLGILVGLFVVFLFLKPKLMASLFIAIVVFLAILFSQRQTLIEEANRSDKPIVRRAASILDSRANADRTNMWKAGCDIIKDHFLLGIGGYNSDTMLPYYQAIEKKTRKKFQHSPGTGVHNIYLQIWIDFGIIGITGYLLFWFGLLYKIFQTVFANTTNSKEKFYLIGIAGGLCGSMVAGFFENNFRDGEVQITIFFMMGLALSMIYKLEKQ